MCRARRREPRYPGGQRSGPCGRLTRGQAAESGSRIGQPNRAAESGNVDELLGGVALNEEVTVIEGFEVNFDDIGTGVVDPHTDETMGCD